MRTQFHTERKTITLEGTVHKPTENDLDRIKAITAELKSRHLDGLICFRTSKRTGYRQLGIEWRTYPVLEPEGKESITIPETPLPEPFTTEI